MWLGGDSAVRVLFFVFSFFPREPRFDSQHLPDEQSATPIPGPLLPFSGTHRHCMYMAHRLTCRQNTHTHKIIFLNTEK